MSYQDYWFISKYLNSDSVLTLKYTEYKHKHLYLKTNLARSMRLLKNEIAKDTLTKVTSYSTEILEQLRHFEEP